MVEDLTMSEPVMLKNRLASLRLQLDQLNRSWTVEDYETFLRFYVKVLPDVIGAERATIFVSEPGVQKIWSMFGTGLDGIRIEPPTNESVVGKAISTGNYFIEHDLDKRPGFHSEIDALTGFVTRSLICVPIKSMYGHGITGAVEVLNKRNAGFCAEDVEKLQGITQILSTSIESVLVSRQILNISSQMNSEIERVEKGYFRDVPFIAESPVMQNILDRTYMVSKAPVNVLLYGEQGTGKELIARMIHEGSDRSNKPFVAVNSAAIPEALVESEFFGYEKGAFTGAVSSRKGRLEEADGGTLFLDEVADMSLTIQPKFLRAIQEGESCRLGSNQLRRYDIRIICSTNKDLRKEIAEGRFREDLFFRLFSVEIELPPLRERQEDIRTMALAFLDRVSERFKKRTAGFSPEVLNLFDEYPWPGNVRQLIREVEHLVALTPENEHITIDRCSRELRGFACTPAEKDCGLSLPGRVRSLEIRLIQEALRQAKGNKHNAAELLGITRQGLHKKLNRLGPFQI